MKLKHFVASVALLGSAVVLTACGGSTTVTSSDGQTVTKVDSNSGTVTSSNSSGNITMTTGDSAQYPATFPVSQYPGSSCKLTIDSKLKNDASSSDSVMLTTRDPLTKVVDHYKTWFEGNGWKVDSQVSSDQNAMLVASKGQQTASVMAMPNASGGGVETSITLTVSGK